MAHNEQQEYDDVLAGVASLLPPLEEYSENNDHLFERYDEETSSSDDRSVYDDEYWHDHDDNNNDAHVRDGEGNYSYGPKEESMGDDNNSHRSPMQDNLADVSNDNNNRRSDYSNYDHVEDGIVDNSNNSNDNEGDMDSSEPTSSPGRIRSPIKKMFGENGWLSRTPSSAPENQASSSTPKPKRSGLKDLGGMIKRRVEGIVSAISLHPSFILFIYPALPVSIVFLPSISLPYPALPDVYVHLDIFTPNISSHYLPCSTRFPFPFALRRHALSYHDTILSPPLTHSSIAPGSMLISTLLCWLPRFS